MKAFIFDLDDTLCPEIEYVKSGFCAIAKAFSDESLYDKLWSLFSIDTKNVYQRAGFSEEDCRRAIEIYRNHKPDIALSPDAVQMLDALKKQGYKLGLITDGRPNGQRNKIEALSLAKWMDAIIVTDELGGESFRKPNPAAFEMMREKLSVRFEDMVYIGDNPKKDFDAPKKLGMQWLWFKNQEGLYTEVSSTVAAKRIVYSFQEIIERTKDLWCEDI